MKIDLHYQLRRCSAVTVVSGNIRFMEMFAGVTGRGASKFKRQCGCRKRHFSVLSLTVSSDALELRPTALLSIKCDIVHSFAKFIHSVKLRKIFTDHWRWGDFVYRYLPRRPANSINIMYTLLERVQKHKHVLAFAVQRDKGLNFCHRILSSPLPCRSVLYLDTLESSATPQSTAAAADDDDAAGSSAGGDGMSDSQRELVSIMQQVKSEHLTVREAELCFYDWKTRHDGGFTRSFKERQVSRCFGPGRPGPKSQKVSLCSCSSSCSCYQHP